MSSRHTARLGVSGIALVIATFPWLPWAPVVGYAALFIASSALYLVTAPALARASLSGRELAAVLGLLFVLRGAFLATTPIGSDDFHRYIWDGKVQAAGTSPYRYAPDAPDLQPLHGETLPRLVNHPTMKTPYFPLAEWAFRLAYGLAGEAAPAIGCVLEERFPRSELLSMVVALPAGAAADQHAPPMKTDCQARRSSHRSPRPSLTSRLFGVRASAPGFASEEQGPTRGNGLRA